MFIRRLFAVVLLGSMTVSLAAAEEEERPARVAPEQVLLTLPSDNEAVEKGDQKWPGTARSRAWRANRP
jgi:hypothetical protein